MNKERVEKLIAALRSGEFEQTRGQLRYENRYCCLGVACELYARDTGEGKWIEDPTSYSPSHMAFSADIIEPAILPPSVSEYYGFGQIPEVDFNGQKRGLSSLNDREGLTFEQLADLLEKELNAQVCKG